MAGSRPVLVPHVGSCHPDPLARNMEIQTHCSCVALIVITKSSMNISFSNSSDLHFSKCPSDTLRVCHTDREHEVVKERFLLEFI
jgi:hypothetical protein